MSDKHPLLLQEPPLVIQPSLAFALGLHEAIILQQIQYWVSSPKAQERDGKRWVYNSYPDWQQQFPFLSCDQIARAIRHLETNKVLVTGNYNTKTSDRTKWYTIDYEALNLLAAQSSRASARPERTSARPERARAQSTRSRDYAETSVGPPPEPAGPGGPTQANSEENDTKKVPRPPRQQTAANAVLKQVEQEWGQPVVHWAKEAKAIRAALDRGYTQEQVLACWRASQESPRWKGQWIPMAFLVEDLGEFVKTGPPRKWTMGPRLSTQPKYRDHRDYPKEF